MSVTGVFHSLWMTGGDRFRCFKLEKVKEKAKKNVIWVKVLKNPRYTPCYFSKLSQEIRNITSCTTKPTLSHSPFKHVSISQPLFVELLTSRDCTYI